MPSGAALAATPMDVNNQDANFPIKVHMISNPESCNAFLLESDGEFAVVDSGEDSDYRPDIPGVTQEHGVEDLVIAYLKGAGVNNSNFRYYIGTHPHSDHIGSADEVIEAIQPGSVITPKYVESAISEDAIQKNTFDNQVVYNDMLAAAAKYNIPVTTEFPSDPYVIPLGRSTLTIHNANNTKYRENMTSVNSMSLMVKMTAPNGKSVIIGGDMDCYMNGEQELGPKIGQVDIASVNHHGYYGSNSHNYLETLRARIWLCPNKNCFSSTQPDWKDPDKDHTSYNSFIRQLNNGARLVASGEAHEYSLPAVVVNLDETLSNNIPGDLPGKLTGYSNAAYGVTFTTELRGGRPLEKAVTRAGLWINNGAGWWLRRGDNTTPANEILEDSGHSYHFNKEGYLSIGWFKHEGNDYCTDDQGAILKDHWQQYGSEWYYLKSDGTMARSEKTPDGNEVDATGARIRANGSGRWRSDATGWWYEYADGTYPRSTIKTIDRADYHFSSQGYMSVGWCRYSGKYYFASGSGALRKKHWQSDGGKWYYLKEDGSMAVSEKTTDGYEVGADGAWLDPNGGTWKSDATGWWYAATDGTYPRNTIKTIHGVDYHFSAQGYMSVGWCRHDGKYYFAASSGALMKRHWQSDGGKWYYLKADGSMAVSEKTDDGYEVDADGVWIA